MEQKREKKLLLIELQHGKSVKHIADFHKRSYSDVAHRIKRSLQNALKKKSVNTIAMMLNMDHGTLVTLSGVQTGGYINMLKKQLVMLQIENVTLKKISNLYENSFYYLPHPHPCLTTGTCIC